MKTKVKVATALVLGAVLLAFQVHAKDGCNLEVNKDGKEVLGIEGAGFYCGNWEFGAPTYIAAAVDGDVAHYAYRVQIRRKNYDFDGKAEIRITDEGNSRFSFSAGGGSRVTATIKGDELHASYIGPNGRSTAVLTRQDGGQVSLAE